eukprot:3103275-Alexandrium_andersonii.AAC.1
MAVRERLDPPGETHHQTRPRRTALHLRARAASSAAQGKGHRAGAATEKLNRGAEEVIRG